MQPTKGGFGKEPDRPNSIRTKAEPEIGSESFAYPSCKSDSLTGRDGNGRIGFRIGKVDECELRTKMKTDEHGVPLAVTLETLGVECDCRVAQ